MANKSGRKTDWAAFIIGILVALCGIVIMVWPGLSLVMLAEIAGVWLLVAAVFGFITWGRTHKVVSGSGWTMANAICDVILGLMFLTHPIVAAGVIPLLVGCFVVAYGIFAIATAISMRSTIGSGWGIMVLNGIISLLCGILFIVFPAFFAIYLGVFMVMRGVTMTVLSVTAPGQMTIQ